MDIPKKYAIGMRPLSLLLGWGELTFSRYCDGDIPTKQYSDILKKIYEDPEYYAKILDNNKDKLNSNKAYEKSKNAVDSLIGTPALEKQKIYLTIDYLLSRCEDITPLALQKALYYIQGFYFAFNNSYIFSQDCEAWVHGPVYREAYNKYCNYQFNPIENKVSVDENNFSTMEISIFDSVIKNICCYSGKVLENFTHKEIPWVSTRGELPEKILSNKTIPKDQIGEYFKRVKEKYNMITPNDIRQYTQYMFESI